MRMFLATLALACGWYALASDDTRDRRPPDALKVVSFNHAAPLDLSPLAQTATVGAGATFPARVADFGGTSGASITFPDLAAFEVAPFTVAFWARIDSSSTRVSLVAKNTSTAAPVFYRGWYMHFLGTSAGSYGIVLTANTDGTNYRTLYSGNASTHGDGTWRHYAWTCDSIAANTGWVFYVNGAAVSMTSLTAGTVSTMANSEPLTIGGFTTANQTAYLDGALDGLMIWPRVLSAAEVNALWAEDLGVTRP